MATKKSDSKKSGSAASKLGLAAALVSATAAGVYLFGKEGAEKRHKIRGWTLKAKGEVLEELERRKEVTKESYQEAVDKITAKYARMSAVGEVEAQKLGRELKRHWKVISDTAQEKPKGKKAK